MASILKAINFTIPFEYAQKGYAQLEASENPLAKLAVQGLTSAPAQAVKVKALSLFDSYGQYLIPLLGVIFQLIIKARSWADTRREKEQANTLARKQAEVKEQEEKRKSQGIRPFEPKTTSTSTSTATATAESPATTTRKGKGKK